MALDPSLLRRSLEMAKAVGDDKRARKDAQFNAQMGLETAKLEQQGSIAQANLGLDEAKLKQAALSDQQRIGLERENMGMRREQFGQEFGLKQDALSLDKEKLAQQGMQFEQELGLKQQNALMDEELKRAQAGYYASAAQAKTLSPFAGMEKFKTPDPSDPTQMMEKPYASTPDIGGYVAIPTMSPEEAAARKKLLEEQKKLAQ